MKDHRMRIGIVALLMAAIQASVAIAPAQRPVEAAPIAGPVAAAVAAPVGVSFTDLKGQGFYVLDIDTSTVTKIVLPGQSCLIAHLNYQSDGSASGASDYVVVMVQTDTMAANLDAGRKLVIKGGGSARFPAGNMPTGSDGPREIQVKAVGNSAKIQIIVGG